jgi:ElaB/YqjD/DUF883 family membrane-anchored ribosome-binding protein
MPPRDNELPEGTDHIINGAMETNGGGGAAGQESGVTPPSGGATGVGGGSSSGFIGSTAAADGTGGTAAGGGTMAGTSGSSDDTGEGPGDGGGVVGQIRNQASTLRDQAGGRVRDFAEGGKTRASDALEELSHVVADTADSIDERLGGEYGEYARRASDAVSGFADTLRRKEVDEIYDDVRSAVRKSPVVAIGIAAVVGFTLVRLVKAGISADDGDGPSGRAGA